MSTPSGSSSSAAVVWRGVWTSSPSPVYREGHVVADVDLVSVWVAVVANPKREEPGKGDAWQKMGIADLGAALIELHAGAWVAATAYAKGTLVEHQGSTYIAKAASTGVEPPNADSWALLAQAGVKGDTGDQGIQGVKGDQGIQGVAGQQGEQGIQGVAGAKGDTGEQGVPGKPGVQGIQGDKGDEGEEGPEGPQGPKGDTATSGGSLDAAKLVLVDGTYTKVPVTLAPDSQLVDCTVTDGGVVVDVAGTWEFAALVTVSSTAATALDYTVEANFVWMVGNAPYQAVVASESGKAGGEKALTFQVASGTTAVLAEKAVVQLWVRSFQLDPDTDAKPSVEAQASASLIMRRKKAAV